ncbi:MAG: argininosuccinate lyase [Vicinamibacteria bacterium]|nr:argininosuccinate lyase [Vicinamibacteria bacterium]
MTKLWGGNYEAEPDRLFWEFNRSFPFDRRLMREEIAASRAYALALGKCRALPMKDAAKLDRGLARVLAKYEANPAYADIDVEDVHSFVETRLEEEIGSLAGQGHLGRSRNEQSVTALRLFIRGAIDDVRGGLQELIRTLVSRALEGAAAPMPGYTHTREAEPITFGHWAGAHAWALVRDFERLADTRVRVNVLPLGSGALAGTALPLKREALARALGFAAVSENALDAISDRDFAAEFVFVLAQTQTHLSRLAEDLIHYSSRPYGFLALPDAFTTGSSLMPQKKNPDSMELVRGKASRTTGSVVRLLALTSGIPVGYQKDFQEDKEAVFDALDAVLPSIMVATGVVRGVTLNREAMKKAAAAEGMMAASLAVALAREGVPFRKAHGMVGSMVTDAVKANFPLGDLARATLKGRHPRIAARMKDFFDPEKAVAAKAARGGTAPAAVRASLRAARARVR